MGIERRRIAETVVYEVGAKLAAKAVVSVYASQKPTRRCFSFPPFQGHVIRLHV